MRLSVLGLGRASFVMIVAICFSVLPAMASVSIPEDVKERIRETVEEDDGMSPLEKDFESRKDVIEAALANPDFTTPEAEDLFSEAENLAEHGDYSGAMFKLDLAAERLENKRAAVKAYWTMIAYFICYLMFFGYIGLVWARSRGLLHALRRTE